MTVKAVSVQRQRPWHGRWRKYFDVTLTDINGQDHVIEVGPVMTTEADTGEDSATKLLASEKASEVERYKDSIRDGANPFEMIPALWNTRAELLHPILTDVFTLPATDPLVYNGLPYFDLVSDAEMMALFGKDQAWVDTRRVLAADLLANKTELDSYVPPGVD